MKSLIFSCYRAVIMLTNQRQIALPTFATGLIFAVLFSAVLAFSFPTSTAQATGINTQISYQAKLTNLSNVAVADGQYNIEFKLYNVSTGGAALWTETRTGGNKVQITNGVFSVMLGEVTSLSGVDFNQTLYLGVNIGGTGSPSWDGEMSPRRTLGAVPAAMIANSLQGNGIIYLTNTTVPQATLAYDGSNLLTLGVSSAGLTTFTATGSSAGFNFTGGDVTMGSALNVGTYLSVGSGGIQSQGLLTLTNSITSSGSSAIAGIFGDYTLSNATASGFEFGNRFISTIPSSGSQAGTYDGQFIRMIDNSTLGTGQVVRGLEVQAYSGSNVNGINTGIASYGYTFGLQATTTSQAASIVQPAAIYADLDNGANSTTKTRGNAIRAYTNDATSADMVNIYQESSAYTGNLLLFDVANNSGTFASGNFINAKSGGTTKFKVDNSGNASVNLASSTGNFTLCHDTNGTGLDVIKDCNPGPGADYMEFYPAEPNIQTADVVSSGTNYVTTTQGDRLVKVVKTTAAYQSNLLGVVSNIEDAGDFNSIGHNINPTDNPQPVALVGRVRVKATTENGTIQPGDYLTSSATIPGYAMKATAPGKVIGQALASFNGISGNTVLVFVNPIYYDPTQTVDLFNNSVDIQRGTMATQLIASTTNAAAYLINQNGSGDILNVQNQQTSRMLVRNNGATEINVSPNSPSETLFVVSADNSKLFSVDAQGVVAVKNLISMQDDTFAGSIATEADGTAEITFSQNLGGGKPVIQLTPEGDGPVFVQIASWKKDQNGNYAGFIIKSFGVDGTPNPAIVHYLVIAKQEGYNTFSHNQLSVITQSSGNYTIVSYSLPQAAQSPAEDAGTVAGDSTTVPEDSTTAAEDDTSAATDGANLTP